ncbi:winged helix-turn-helix domain-containing protein [Streptomyces sp. Edi2]|uniref:winged helix-turn-helix domain-containing protein n=1 Tax=Streptomyces sp. Edi2 TaxID=3162528 RepID=UPI003305632B
MVLLRLSPMALSRSRFALSPLAETLGSMIVLGKPCSDPWLARWHGRHHPAFAATLDTDPFAKGLVTLFGSTKWLPEFVAMPPSGGMRTTLTSELEKVARVPDEEVRAGLAKSVSHSWKRHDLSWLDGHEWGARTADLLRRVWDTHISPDWPRRRALLERDVTYRAGLLAAYGWPRALAHMSRRSAWVGTDAIRFGNRPGPDRVVGDEGMLFVPVSVASGTWLCAAPPDKYAQVYPARGYAATTDRSRPHHALEQLIGTGRAAILRALEHPATSSELAAHLNRSLGTIGGHLGVLRDADLIAGTRVGRRVVYRRTESGDLLAGQRES